MPVLLNSTYGLLFTVARIDSVRGRQWWLCLCACGSGFVRVRADSLTGGRTRSCGCVRRTSLGMSNSLTYKTWAAMRRRCNDPAHPRYEDYGGRGISVCERWNNPRTGFAAFLEDVGLRPDGRTLDRKDVDGNYEPGNVRWATLREQRWNRRDYVRPGGSESGDGLAEERAYWDEVEAEAAEAEAALASVRTSEGTTT